MASNPFRAMKKEEIQQLFAQFEAAASELEGVECWSARELAPLFGYAKWENFSKVVVKAREACANVGNEVSDHFPGVRKMVELGSGAEREHVDNNTAVRQMLIKRGIIPENLPLPKISRK